MSKVHKFKKGDKVHVVGNSNQHEFDWGSEIEIVSLLQSTGTTSLYQAFSIEKGNWYVREYDIIEKPIIEKAITIKD